MCNWHIKRLRRVWRYQKGNQNPYIVEEKTAQWPKEIVQKDKQRTTKHTHKTNDRVIWIMAEFWWYGRVSSFCCTSGTRRIVTNTVINREWGKDREVLATSGTYLWSFVTQIVHNSQPNHGGDRKIFEVMTSTLPIWTFGPVGSLLAANPLSRESW